MTKNYLTQFYLDISWNDTSTQTNGVAMTVASHQNTNEKVNTQMDQNEISTPFLIKNGEDRLRDSWLILK